MRCGHDPRQVGWFWPIYLLLGFVHVEMRRQGMRTYRPSAYHRIKLEDTFQPVEIEDSWAEIV